ncbi:MAG: hypothetical protein ACN6PJ_30875 [Achromobacter sp.]|uniref:hypothetical protein n=1 Tax=Achromobacter sp. TaxID=134375 RepID=UPI003CFCA276
MTENNAAQAAEQDPLSDEYVNAVIQRHGYQSPETVIARLHQWIGRNGGENGVTLLMYEAHKVLSKLRAPVAEIHVGVSATGRDATICIMQPHADGSITTIYSATHPLGDSMGRAALASAPVADESPMAKAAEALREKARQERQAYQDRREADRVASAPVAGEAHAVAVVEVSVPHLRSISVKIIPDAPMPNAGDLLYAAPQASEADALIDALGQCRDAFPLPDIVGSKLDLLWQEAMSDPSAVPAYIKARAALSAQPGAQRTGGSDAG